MNDWPEGRDDAYGRGSARPQPEGVQRMRHIQRQPQQPPRPQRPAGPVPTPGVPPQQAGGHDTYGGYDSGYNTGQVYG
ncbi:LytR family transcriptional regulator, partial [Streptomyces virginiae]